MSNIAKLILFLQGLQELLVMLKHWREARRIKNGNA